MILYVDFFGSVGRSTVQVFDLVRFLSFEGIMLNENTKVCGLFLYALVLCVFLTTFCTKVVCFKGTVHTLFFVTVIIAIMNHTFVIIHKV